MYDFFTEISSWFSGPFAHAARSSEIAFVAVLFFGFAGSIAPCQMTANLGSIAYFGNKYMKERLKGLEFASYLLGKMAVFSVFGFLFWWLGKGISTELIPLYIVARKLVGPMLIVIGLFFLGFIRLPGSLGFRLADRVELLADKAGGNKGAFLLGVAFSLGFCPTMLWLFFGLVMPIALSSSYGMVLPSVFALGTALPLLLFFGLILGFGMEKLLIKKMKVWSRWVQKGLGVILIILGISDTLTYWTL
jgi:cytochrome c-type biogenesis protein